MKTIDQSQLQKTLLTGTLILLPVALVVAGDGGTEFDAVYDMLEGWATGTLGKIIALSALIVGIGFGLVRQSVIAAVIGGILTATGEGADLAGVALLANGLAL